MNKWRYLKSGDIIDVVATAPGVNLTSLDHDLEVISLFVESLGLKARINSRAIIDGADYFSDKAQVARQTDLNHALAAPDSKAIWFLRGGYGSAKLLPGLVDKPEIPKLLIGYSDLNCIHLFVSKFWNWPSLHARVLYDFIKAQDYADVDTLKDIIFGKHDSVTYSHLSPLNKQAQTSKEIHSKITGGTIQVLQSGIGLPWQFDAADKILFFEEIFDRGVRLDRTLNHFKQLGLFNKTRAILFGDIICGTETNGEQHCDFAVKHFAESMNIPVLSIANIGHANLNYPLPLNSDSILSLRVNSASLTCDNGGKHG